MPTLFFIPGFSASELCLDRFGGRVYWVDYNQIFLRTPGAMQLDAEGIEPGGNYGIHLYPGLPLTPYAGTISAVLRQQLSPASYSVLDFTWDWRKDLYSAGLLLAGRIGQLRPDQLPVSIVGHSAGGLVARAAWHVLRTANRQSAIRRIVTLASPHLGTYFAVATWCGISELVVQLVQLGQLTGGWFGSYFAYQLGAWGADAIVNVALTWPALYQLLPVLGASDSAEDPNRPLLYDGGEWHGVAGAISQKHLAEVLTVRDAWLKSPDSHPPPHVMTAVSGDGFSTPATLARPEVLGLPQCLGSTTAGDSVVTTASAEGDFEVTYRVVGKHSDIPVSLAKSGILGRLILDERKPADPPPPPVSVTRPIPVTLGGPPVPSLGLLPMWEKTCPRGACTC